MRKRGWRRIVATCVAALLCGTVVAHGQQKWGGREFDNQKLRSTPAFWGAFGLGVRIDDVENIQEDLNFTGSGYFYLTPGIALRAGFDYANSISAVSTQARVWSVFGGLRLHVPGNGVSPYVEFGMNRRAYAGVAWDREIKDTRVGLDFAVGISIRLSKTGALDITARQVINSLDMTDVIVAPQNLPPDDQSFVYYWGPLSNRFPGSVYNPATILIQYRFRL